MSKFSNYQLKLALASLVSLFSLSAWSACTQTLSSGANLSSAISNAAAGSTICLNAGNYGSLDVVNISKASDVTIQSTSGKTASIGLNIWASNHLKFQNLTITALEIQDASKNLSIVGSTFTGQAVIKATGTAVNILIDSSTFDGITVCTDCYEGRLHVVSGDGMVVSNNHFGGGGESDGIQLGASGVTIGPGNVFEGLLQGSYGRHIDAIQGYGQANTKIINNYFINNTIYIGFYDGGSNETISGNVFGPSSTNEQKVQLGSVQGLTFTHNSVVGNFVIAQGAKNGNARNTNAVYRNNLFVGTSIADTGDQPGCASGCVYEYNLFSTSGNARGTNNVIGSPTFTGGANPTTWAGYKLTSASLGYLKGNDGKDMGTNYYGTGTATPAGLAAPTNLRLVSATYNQLQLQFDNSNTTQLGFNINRKTGSTGTYSQVGTITAVSFADTAVVASTQYCYTVQAYDSSSSSPVSNELCVSTTSAPVTTPTPLSGEKLFTTQVPAKLNNTNGASYNYELGMKFTTAVAGQIKGVRFYKSPSETGTHIGKIYSSTGTLLASATFTSESASGWQEQALATPLSILANTTYVVAVNTINSYFVSTPSGLASQVVNGNIKSVVGNNGVYGPVGSMPSTSYQNQNYFRDIVFSATTTPAVVTESLFTTQAPSTLNNSDGASVNYELGMKFTTTVAGQINSLKFYKSTSESGTHTGKIYSSTGTLLASVTFTNETASGWQTQALTTPLTIAANTTYVVSVNTGNTYYVATESGMASQITNGHIKSVVGTNGVYGAVGAMPTSSYKNTNYFRDIVFVAK
jgi:hypothetical protein